jgi:hypothetical protein
LGWLNRAHDSQNLKGRQNFLGDEILDKIKMHGAGRGGMNRWYRTGALGLALAAAGALTVIGQAAAQASAGPLTYVYTPPRQLSLNFWVPGDYTERNFNVRLNGLSIPFTVAYDSNLLVSSQSPFGPGTYTLSGSPALPPQFFLPCLE